MQAPSALLQELQNQGIDNPHVLAAIGKIPRQHFVLAHLQKHAYDNRALPIRCEQTISQPYIVALMTQAICLHPSPEKILEIGTGSGYQTAILATLFKSVWTIERIRELHVHARGTLGKLGLNNIHYRLDDGSKGWPQAAPFDGILVTAAAAQVPTALLEQLSPQGGLMVIPLGEPNEVQKLTLIQRQGDTYQQTPLEQVCFVPLITDQE